jgi:hypothetical protein
MLVEKRLERNASGYISRIIERCLTPLEQVAGTTYQEIIVLSLRPDLHGREVLELTIDMRPAPAWCDAAELRDAVAVLAATDHALWKRSGWKRISLKVQPRPRCCPRCGQPEKGGADGHELDSLSLRGDTELRSERAGQGGPNGSAG